MSDNPLVSILVPVYNGSRFIRRFLDSALDQELDDFEIVCVDDLSTDDTLDILEQYRKEFPDKLFIYPAQEHCGSIGAMRNRALSYARGKYIYWCDQDDILHPCGLKTLADTAEEHDCEIVCGWAFITNVGEDGIAASLTALNKKQTQAASIQAAIINGIDYWVRLLRRDFVLANDPIPEDCFFDDVAYMPCLQSNANNIRFVNFPVYYYHRRTDSASGSVSREVCEGSVKAEKYAIAHCKPEYLHEVQYYAATRTEMNLNMRWQYFDVFVDWAREQMQWAHDNPLITRNKRVYDRLKWAASLTENVMPARIYVNGFGTTPTEQRLEELREKVFYDECEIVVLSEDNCDVSANEYVQAAYDNGQLQLVAHYFVLKNIYEYGGIYIADNIRLINFISYYRYQHAVFFRLDRSSYTDSVFGAPADNPVYKDLLETFSSKWDKHMEFASLKQRIKTILTAKYNIPLDNSGIGFAYPVSIVTVNVCVADINYGKIVFEHDFTDLAGEEGYITLSRSQLNALCDLRALTGGSRAGTSVSARERALSRELQEIKQSNSWKMAMKIRKLGDGPCGPFLKKIFYGMLKIRNKFKRKKKK